MRRRLRRRIVVCLIGLPLLLTPAIGYGQRGGPSDAFRAGLQKTLEKRKQRRFRRGQVRSANAMAPWMMPPALIIRATPGVHDEVEALLRALRRGP